MLCFCIVFIPQSLLMENPVGWLDEIGSLLVECCDPLMCHAEVIQQHIIAPIISISLFGFRFLFFSCFRILFLFSFFFRSFFFSSCDCGLICLFILHRQIELFTTVIDSLDGGQEFNSMRLGTPKEGLLRLDLDARQILDGRMIQYPPHPSPRGFQHYGSLYFMSFFCKRLHSYEKGECECACKRGGAYLVRWTKHLVKGRALLCSPYRTSAIRENSDAL